MSLHAETLLALARKLAERIHSVEDLAEGGCPTCRDGEARAFLAQLRQLAAESGRQTVTPASVVGYHETDSA